MRTLITITLSFWTLRFIGNFIKGIADQPIVSEEGLGAIIGSFIGIALGVLSIIFVWNI